jgi:rod shape-determining protein MreD
MTEFSDEIMLQRTRKDRSARYQPVVMSAVCLAAILFQVYVPLLFQYLSFLELPLLVTVYFALMKRNQIAGLTIGFVVGLLQDSLSHHPLGLFGIVKTLVGYFAASVSMRFDVENPVMRAILAFFFFLFHQAFFWLLTSALLEQRAALDLARLSVFAALNAAVALPLFAVLDKMKGTA